MSFPNDIEDEDFYLEDEYDEMDDDEDLDWQGYIPEEEDGFADFADMYLGGHLDLDLPAEEDGIHVVDSPQYEEGDIPQDPEPVHVAHDSSTYPNVSSDPTSTRTFCYDELEAQARAPLYEGARVSRLSSILLLNNLQSKYGVNDSFMSELFGLLHSKILPPENVMPKSRGETRKVLRSIGMEYKVIHACRNDCTLFRGPYKDYDKCPNCEASRYRDDTKGDKIPVKVRIISSSSSVTSLLYVQKQLSPNRY